MLRSTFKGSELPPRAGGAPRPQTDPVDDMINSIDDLRSFSTFIFQKMADLANSRSRDTCVDSIFKKSLREFHQELISYEAALKVITY